MSRLIDADLLKENISKWLKPSKPDETKMIEVTDALVSTMMEIDEQPTAFDVDKVIEQIESIKEKEYGACTDEQCGLCDYFNDCWDGEMCDKLALDKAIEIVRGGGIDGQDG